MIFRQNRCFLLVVCAINATWVALAGSSIGQELQLQMRCRVPANSTGTRHHTVDRPATWDAKETAIVVCDMWNEHWCEGATRRVAEMAPRMNRVINAAREKGVLVIHCPSSCMEYYKDSLQRKLAQSAPKVTTKIPLQGWCHLDRAHEDSLPIDDSDGGCDCQPQCSHGSPWFRQIDTIEIKQGDAITDSAEAYYLMKQRGIKNVIVMGVHTNMCVLGRPFSIRQMVYQGQNVALMRDMTDTMYNSRMRPFVDHHAGTDLVIEHIEKHWCPTIASNQVIGGDEFRFSTDRRQHLALVIGEREYHTRDTLPEFAAQYLASDFRVSIVYADQKDGNHFPGIEVLDEADVAIISVRRRALPTAQLAVIRKFVADGKPLVAIRTSSHAFALRDGKAPDGHELWPEFDQEVLGGNYHNHHGNKGPDNPKTFVRVESSAIDHPILAGVRTDEFQVPSWLYMTQPLTNSTTLLMMGRVGDRQPHEPVAWTNTTKSVGRVFYTSLGHPGDFRLPAFQQMLSNAVFWAAGVKTE